MFSTPTQLLRPRAARPNASHCRLRSRIGALGAWLVLAAALAPAVESQAQRPTATREGAFLEGAVELLNRRGTRPARSVSMDEVIVLYRPEGQEAMSVAADEGPFVMATENKTYLPTVLPVPLGATVAFPNRDRILHNVFSVSGENRFDLDLMEGGETRSQRFEHPGLVRIFCNVHRDMVGYVWVLDSPHFERPSVDGRFRFRGLPPGPGTLTVWHPRADPVTQDVVVGPEAGGAVSLELRITRPRLPSHARKDGSAYRTREVY